jgi:hypothetical protein
MRMMHSFAASFVARLHPSAIGADARQGDRRLRLGVLPRQRLIEVRLGSRVTPGDHFAPIFTAVLFSPRPVSWMPPIFRSISSPIEYDGAYAAASTFFSNTAGLAEPPSIRNGMRCGKKIPLTGRTVKGRLAKPDFAVVCL